MTVRAQIVIPYFTNVPSDVVTNTLHFRNLVPSSLATVAAAVHPLIEDFLNTIYGPSLLANYVNASGIHVNYYDLTDPPPRSPITTAVTLTGVSTTSSPLPTEVAAVLSFQGTRVSGTPQARRRGRIFIGALGAGVVTSSSASAFPIFNSSVRTSIGNAAGNLKDDSATAGYPWAVWSPTDQVDVVVDNGWVDNTPDTQRRRTVDETARTLWS